MEDAASLEKERTSRHLQQKVLELDLATSYMHSLLENMRQGILFVGLTGTIRTLNKSGRRLLGVEETAIEGESFWDRFDDHALGFSLRHALQRGGCPHFAQIDWNERKLEISTTYVTEGDVDNHGLMILIRDVTELTDLRRRADQTERLKLLGETAALIAHEVRNPLGGISGFAHLLMEDLQHEPRLAHIAKQICDGCTQLEELVSSVLHFAHPLEIQRQECRLEELVAEVVELVRADPIAQYTEIVICSKAQGFSIHADPSAIKAALLNLVVNGIEAMADGGRLSVSIEKTEHEVVVHIHDEGIGIEEDQLNKIFSPFYTSKESGTGLGLAEVARIAQAHKGHVEAHSKPSHGSTFSLYLPGVQL